MGHNMSVPQTQSVPQRLHHAAKHNYFQELQAILEKARANQSLDPAALQSWLDWVDREGRTGLMWAAERNYYHVVQLLLAEGADLHKVAPSRTNGGSALAEAVAAGHEGLVKLLLRHGADPFIENAAGQAPMDVALESESGAVGILRACERHALFAGYVSTRVSSLGFTYVHKDRWVVISPRRPPRHPTGDQEASSSEIPVSLMMFRSAEEGTPLTRISLKNAVLILPSDGPEGQCEAQLRLDPSHTQPHHVYCKRDAGWVLHFKPAQAAAPAALGTLPAATPPDVTFQCFLTACSSPQEVMQQQQQQRGRRQQPAVRLAAAAGAQHHDELSALPGETDEAFALRLAAMSDSAPVNTPRTADPAADGAVRPGARRPGGSVLHDLCTVTALYLAVASAVCRLLAWLITIRLSARRTAVPGARAGSGRQQRTTTGCSSTQAGRQGTPLSAAPGPSTGGGSKQAVVSAGDREADVCVICLSAAREVGLMHGRSVHVCLCKGCADMVREGQPCPLCRQKVERVLGVF